ncbi:hypothetical protein HF888_16430 (plasmid) [Bermanella marisrubri]|nr:hypothetical protein [Bermanella marisrubri]QIZ85927.1 hypothetical protein HF888_16430 [Bermanella marisrubri]
MSNSDQFDGALKLGRWYRVVEEYQPDGSIELLVHDTRTGDVYSIEVPDLESYNKLVSLLSDGSITRLKKVMGL